MKKIAIYTRKSVYKDSSESIANQEKWCRDYIIRTKLKNAPVEVYSDEGISGKNTDRPAFKRMLKDIKSGKIQALVCYKLDRVSRSTKDAYTLIEELELLNVDFISITEQFDTTTPVGRAQMGMASIFAQLEREQTAARVKDSMLELAKEGKWTGGNLPTGLSSEKIYYIDEDGKRRSYIKLKHNEQIELVKQIFEQYILLGSVTRVQGWMVENDLYFKHQDKAPGKSTIKRILRNPCYVKADDAVVAFLVSRKWEVFGEVDGYKALLTYKKKHIVIKDGKKEIHKSWLGEGNIAATASIDGVIDAKVWLQVQKQLDDNRMPGLNPRANGNSILGGILRCPECDSKMMIKYGSWKRKDGTRKRYYACIRKAETRSRDCNAKMIVAEDIENAVLDYLESISPDDIIPNKEIKDTSRDIKKLIREKERKIKSLVDKIADDPDLVDIFGEKLKALKSEKIQLERRLIEYKPDKTEIIINTMTRLKPYRNLSKEDKRLLISTVCKEIRIEGDTIKITVALVGQ